MKSNILSLALLCSAALALPNNIEDRGEEVVFIHEPDFLASSDAYASGEVHMSLMQRIIADVEALRNSTLFDDPLTLTPITKYTPCINGFAGTKANHTYSCNNLDLYSYSSHALLGSDVKLGNDIWGWSYDSGNSTREFGLIGQQDGTAFVEITVDGQTVYLGRLPTQSVPNLWRDIKVIGNHAYIGSEALDHGIQIFDLTKLLDKNLVEAPKNFSISTDLTAHYNSLPVGSSHNIVAHQSKNLIAAVGSMPRTDICASGLIFVDVTDPASPKSAGCASEDGYVHDAQCLTYYGPHQEFVGTDICYSFNENTFTIYNITTPSNPIIISTTSYYGVSYSHQGWVVDETDQRYLLLDDELDEMEKRGWAVNQTTVTYIWDIQNLTKPLLTGHYNSPARAIDHNLYIVDGLAYEANYCSGLRIVNVSSVNEDPTGSSFYETAFFDVYPGDDDVGGEAKFGGSWSSYPYFKSKYILINSMERGLFVVKYRDSSEEAS